MTTTPEDRARMRAYYRAHREKLLAYNREYRKTHNCRKYRAATTIEEKLKRSEYNRKYYEENREKVRAYQRAWRTAHPDYNKQKLKEWRLKNHDCI